jgi:hypothetical protein
MTLPRTATEVLSERVVFEVESIDRLYLNVYQPRLQHGGGVTGFFVDNRGFKYASSVLMKPLTDAFVAEIHHFVGAHDLDLVYFRKGQRKDDITQRHLAEHDGSEQVLYVGLVQEKTPIWRTQRRYNPVTGTGYCWLVRESAMVNQVYFYCFDDDFGPFFLKFSTYFPFTAKACVNGNEYAKRQAAKAGIAFTPMDNGFAAVDDLAALQRICDSLGEEQITALIRKWMRILPHPFTEEDIAAGYTYDISMLQAEFSLTQVLDKPISGRIFFEQVIRDNLDIGRPDKVALIFGKRIHRGRKRPTPGVFSTRVITDGVTPNLHIEYKHNRIKQYHKQGQALRTETTINNPGDFYLGKRLSNLAALRQIGFTANRRLLDVQCISHDPATGAEALAALTDPLITATGQRIPGLRFTDPRVQALLAVLCLFRLQPAGLTNRDLRTHLASLLGYQSEDITSGQATYDLRRLRAHGLIERIPHTHRYQITDTGLRYALFLTRVHTRLLRTGLAELTDPDPPQPSPLRAAHRAYQAAVDNLIIRSGLAA